MPATSETKPAAVRRAWSDIGPAKREHTDVVVDANVTSSVPTPEFSDEQTAVPPTAEPKANESHVESDATPGPQSQDRAPSMPKPAVTREQVDKVGRIALEAGKGGVRFITGAARCCARVVRHLIRAIAAVPPTLRLLSLAGILMLLGIVGAIALHNSLGLACIVVVIPICSITLGALGYSWYAGLGGQRVQSVESPAAETTSSDLQRSVEYIDKKLTFALTAFGTERHQHAMIALFQAKTAVELTLGTEQDPGSDVDALLSVDDHNARPRIRAGSSSKSSLRESNSLVAS